MHLIAILDELLQRGVISLAWSQTARSSVRKLAKASGVPPDTLEATSALEKDLLPRLRSYILAQGGAISTAFTQASDIRRLLRLGRRLGLRHALGRSLRLGLSGRGRCRCRARGHGPHGQPFGL